MNDDYHPKRRHKRYKTQDVKGSLLFRTRVDVVDISLAGMAVESTERLDIERKYSMTVSHDEENIQLRGRVVWCHLANTRKSDRGEVLPVYRAGIEFEGVLNEPAKDLLAFIQHNAVLSLEERIFGRFRFRTESSVDLDSEYEFVVHTISLSGMLIETDLLPEPDSVFEMEVNFPEEAVTAKGRVAHIRQVGQNQKHSSAQLGIEFSDLSPKSRDVLERFIQQQVR